MTGVVIRGDGIAAAGCAHLLAKAKIPVQWEKRERPRLPAIMLSGTALALLGDVFGPVDALARLHRIGRRVVAWGPDATPVTMPHAAVVASERTLLDAVSSAIPSTDQAFDGPLDMWTIVTAPPLPPQSNEHAFGSRLATAIPVSLRDPNNSDACWVESTSSGWLFLIPTDLDRGYVLAIGDGPETLLEASQLIAPRIERSGPALGEFPAHPRLRWPLCGPRWLACGTAAMAFDPLCGDGTAQAIREAILASAVVQSATRREPAARLLTDYRARLAAGLTRHLVLCEQFYRTGGDGAWWKSQLQATNEGAAWCARQVGAASGFQYQLNGFALQPLPSQAIAHL